MKRKSKKILSDSLFPDETSTSETTNDTTSSATPVRRGESYRESNEETDLPKGWEINKLIEVAKLIKGVTYKKDEAIKEPKKDFIGILRANNINKTIVLNDIVYVPKKRINVEQIIKKGDILIAMSSGSKDLVGKAAQANKDYEYSFGTFCGVIRPSESINKKYLGFYFQTKKYRHYVSYISKGVNINNLKRTHIEDMIIPCPDILLQQKIVSKIEELISELDNGVEELKKVKAQLKIYRESVLNAAFTGKLSSEFRILNSELRTRKVPDIVISGKTGIQKNELPKEWKKLKLKDLSVLITKGASPKWQGFNYTNDNSQLLFVTSENVRENYLDIEKPKFLQLEFNTKQKRSSLKYGDVLFNLVGASIGRATIYNLDRKANINQAVSVIRLTENLINKYLCYFLNSELAKQTYMKNIVDVARANLSLFDVSNLLIPTPTVNEQQKIVEEIETRLSVCDKMEETIETALAKSESLRQSILKQAFEGKLIK